MNRLTNEFVLSNIEYGFHLDDEHIKFVKDKLEYADKMKAIEQDLGCSLEVVFKALKDGQVITKHIVGSENPKVILLPHKIAEILFDVKNYSLWAYENGCDDGFYLNTKDYKKTWWLKEDRRE